MLAGFSLGAQLALRLVSEYEELFSGAAVISPWVIKDEASQAKAYEENRKQLVAHELRIITVVDGRNVQKHYDNFGDLFDAQILSADCFYISKLDGDEKRLRRAEAVIRSLREDAVILSKPVSEVSLIDFTEHAGAEETVSDRCSHKHHGHEHDCDCGHEHHEHSHDCSCGHEHHTGSDGSFARDLATEAVDGDFTSVTLHFPNRVKRSALDAFLTELTSDSSLLRIKGFVPTETETLLVQFVPGQLTLEPSDSGEAFLSIIGRRLKAKEILEQWSKSSHE